MKLNILAFNGSASASSSNESILNIIALMAGQAVSVQQYSPLYELPPFQTTLTDKNVPESIVQVRNKIALADGIIFSTPEYIFSIPSALKNLLEWCVSTTVFSEKPVAIITASASGEMGHKELNLILSTLQATLTSETNLLVKGIKSKFSDDGKIIDTDLENQLELLVANFTERISLSSKSTS